MAFSAALPGGGTGVFTSKDRATTAIAGSFESVGSVAINEDNTVAFNAGLDAVDQGIFTTKNGATTTITDTSGPFNLLLSPAINDESTVAFFAGLDEGGFGIFTGPNPATDKVIASGDPLFGSTVQFIQFSNTGLNNSGQVAFSVQLADGTSAIVRADPAINGTEGNDRLIGTPNNERINGRFGNDVLIGRTGNDILAGGTGDDLLIGNAGDDILDGGIGNDQLFDVEGADKFVLRPGEGKDTIFGYQDGIDSFLLANGLEFEKLTITQGFGQTEIKLTDTNEVLASLIGVQANVIGAENFATLV